MIDEAAYYGIMALSHRRIWSAIPCWHRKMHLEETDRPGRICKNSSDVDAYLSLIVVFLAVVTRAIWSQGYRQSPPHHEVTLLKTSVPVHQIHQYIGNATWNHVSLTIAAGRQCSEPILTIIWYLTHCFMSIRIQLIAALSLSPRYALTASFNS